MKHWKWLVVAVLLAGLVLTLAGCGGEQQTEEPKAAEIGAGEQITEIEPTQVQAEPTEEPTQAPAVEPTEEPTAEPTEGPAEEPTAAPTEEPEAEPTEEAGFPAVGSLEELTSYRSTMVMTIKGVQAGEDVEQSLEMTSEATSDPYAMHVSISGFQTGPEEGLDSMEMYVVGDTAHILIGDMWMSAPSTETEDITEGLLAPQSMLEDTCGWERQADTELRGIAVQHWQVDQDALEECATAEMLEEFGTIESLAGDLYVAVDGGYLVQMDLTYEGEDLGLDLGVESEEPIEEASLELHWQFTDVNEPFTIEVPEEALAASGLPDDIPLPEGSGGVSSAFGLLTFSTTQSAEDVYAFYIAEMPNNGWTQESADDMETLFMLEFSKDGRSASFMISTDDDTGETSVLITVLEE